MMRDPDGLLPAYQKSRVTRFNHANDTPTRDFDKVVQPKGQDTPHSSIGTLFRERHSSKSTALLCKYVRFVFAALTGHKGWEVTRFQ